MKEIKKQRKPKERSKLSSYMSPIAKWRNRWKLRRIIMALEGQTQRGTIPLVTDFTRSLEATEIMSRGMKKNARLRIHVERAQLDAFIRYMCSLHDSKISRLLLARIGLATLMQRDEKSLRQPAKEVIETEVKRSGQNRQAIVKAADEQLEMDL